MSVVSVTVNDNDIVVLVPTGFEIAFDNGHLYVSA